jgi:cytoskeletal protein RodZ
MARRRRRDDEQAGPGIGQILRAARGAMGVSVERAAGDTHLRATYLAALERDDAESLGLDPAYIRGALRTYADYLGLDSGALVARQRAGDARGEARRRDGRPPSGPHHTSAAAGGGDVAHDRPLPHRIARVVAGVVVLAVVAVIAFALGQALGQGSLLPTIAGWVSTSAEQVSSRWPEVWVR